MAWVNGTNAAETIDRWDGVTHGHDDIWGYDGNDTIYGYDGADDIDGGRGADTIWGGEGTDTAMYADSWEGVFVSLLSGQGYFGEAQGDRLHSIESLWGSRHADTLIGDGGHNALFGAGGNDTLKGGGGADMLWGGDGIDTVDYAGSSAGVTVFLSGYANGGDATGDELLEIENLSGSAHADFLYGDDAANVLKGMSGDDGLKGYGGADTLYGGEHNDLLYGMDGDDTLYGDIGNDVLVGGAGEDLMYGGAGADTFKFSSIADAPMGGWHHRSDEIADFSSAQGDRIDLSAIDANTLVGTNQPFRWIGNDNDYVPAWGAGQLTFKDGYVQGDVDGDMMSDFVIRVNAPARSLVETDFIL